MAKAAKSKDVELSDRDAVTFKRNIFARLDNIESERGKFMNRVRREREGMTAIYEAFAAKGIPQKIAKINIKIAVLEQRQRRLFADLEAEERKLAQRLAKAQGDKLQLSFFADLPKAPKPPKATKPPKTEPTLSVVENEGAAA